MTTTATQPLPPTFVQDPPRPRSAGRIVAAIAAGLVALVGVTVVIGGAAIMVFFGSDGLYETSRDPLSTSTAAFVSETATIDGADVADALGDARIRVSARADGGEPLFVGVARAADVDRYLAGVAVDRVTDFDIDPLTVDRDRISGDARAAAPTAQDFWVARSDGRDASVDWKIEDGDYRFVVMNADGSPDVHTDARIGVKVPWIGGLGIGLIGIGALAGLAGIAGMALALRRR